jgi:hypothetical protein
MIARIRPDLDDEMATPIVVRESRTHVLVAAEFPKAPLHQHQGILESLLAIARGYESLLAVEQEINGDH